jgi:uncharacterized protein
MDPDRVEIRVLGCLIEKQHTTPDTYPLTLNSLRLACNQRSNRDPVLEISESGVREALDRLTRRRWARTTSFAGSLSMRYEHLLDKALVLSPPQLALLGVLMLRGAQTVGELRARSERLHRFDSRADVEQTLEELVERDLAARLPRRPGQKEGRYEQLLGGDAAGGDREAADDESAGREGEAGAEAGFAPPAAAATEPQRDRIARLEIRITRVEDDLRRLREELGA